MRAQETIHKKLQWESGQQSQRPFLYNIHLSDRRDDIVKVHRFYVPGVDDDHVQVVGIWRDSENHLLQPTTLLYLNRLQQWFDWATLWGTGIQLTAAAELTVEVTQKIDRPYHEYELDRAYHAWLKRNPGSDAASFAAWARDRVNNGCVECEISSCEEPAVIGSTCCAEHQKFA